MIPSIDDRLSSMLRAVQEVILPALGSDQPLAVEQAHLLAGHIALLRQQVDHFLQFEQAEAASLESLGAELVRYAQGGEATTAAVSALSQKLARTDQGNPAAVRAFITEISAGIEALIDASGIDGSEGFMAASASCILKAGKTSAIRDRSWFQAAGFEVGDVALNPVEEAFRANK